MSTPHNLALGPGWCVCADCWKNFPPCSTCGDRDPEECHCARMTVPGLHKPIISSDGFVTDHDMACAVCCESHAVLNTNTGLFEPCWECQSHGWAIKQKISRKCKRGRHDLKEVDTVSDRSGPISSLTNAQCSRCGHRTWMNWPQPCVHCGHDCLKHLDWNAPSLFSACKMPKCTCIGFTA